MELEIKEVAPVETRREEVLICEQAKLFEVSTAEGYESASIFIKTIKEMLAEIKGYFEPKKKRAKEVHTDWCNAEKEACKQLEEAEAILKRKMSKWYMAEQARKQAERAKLEALAKAQNLDPEMIQPAPMEKPKGASQREVWDFKVEDFSKVPDEYKAVNESALREVARLKKEKADVPGIRFYKYYTTVNR